MFRRLNHEQPDSFAFTDANRKWAEAEMTKYPEGRQASAVIALLWRAQEQEGWLSRPAIEYVAEMLGITRIRALEVATFYYMFQLSPVGSVAHVQICGTTSCMICGAEDLIGVCKTRIAPEPRQRSEDGRFSWEEVECLGACANAPMAQIGKDYYEDLTTERLEEILDELAAGKVPTPGPQTGRYASEPTSGLTSLEEYARDRPGTNASVALAAERGDTIRRIDGSEVPLVTPWQNTTDIPVRTMQQVKDAAPKPGSDSEIDRTGTTTHEAPATKRGNPPSKATPKGAANDESHAAVHGASEPERLDAPRGGTADDLKMIKGIGPKLEKVCNSLGFYHFDQIAAWTDAEVAWVDENLTGFHGRVSRDDWVSQARTLAKGGETEFASRVRKGDVY